MSKSNFILYLWIMKKVFDSVNHALSYENLGFLGVPGDILQLIENLYNNASGVIKWENTTSGPFATPAGVRQGCPLPPVLLSLYT